MGRTGRRFVTTAAAVILVAGCSLFQPPPRRVEVPVMAPAPERKQELVIGLPAEPDTLDSTVTAAQEAFTVLGNMMEGLVRLGPDGEVLPGVAERWEVLDEVAYTFSLRADARWSDGRPVTSQDFKFAWLRALDPRRAAAYAFQLYYIQGAREYHTLLPETPGFEQEAADLQARVAIETPDERTLRVILAEPAVEWLPLTAFPTYYPVRQDVVEAHGERYGREAGTLVSNGPFRLESWEPGTGLALGKNPEYWGAGEVRLERVAVRTVPDGGAAVQLFQGGALDRAVIPEQLSAPFQQSGEVITGVQPVTWYLAVNQQRSELQNGALRQALRLAVDRQVLARQVITGASPAEGLVPPVIAAGPGQRFRDVARVHLLGAQPGAEPGAKPGAQPGAEPGAEPGAQPEAKAGLQATETAQDYWQRYLSDTGSSSLTLSLLTGDSTLAKRNGQVLQEMLQNALPGLTVTLEPVPFLTLLERTRTGDYALAYTLVGADYDDAMAFLANWSTTSPFNDVHWLNLEYDSLLRRARAAGAGPVRTAALAEAERLLLAESAVIPLYHPTVTIVQKPWVKGLVNRAMGADLDLRDAWVDHAAP